MSVLEAARKGHPVPEQYLAGSPGYAETASESRGYAGPPTAIQIQQGQAQPILAPPEQAQPAPGEQEKLHMSRRSLLRFVGAGAVVAAAGGTAGYFTTRPDSGKAGTAAAGTPAGGAVTAGPIVVYLRDARTGELEVFAGTTQTTIRDTALAAQLARAVR